MHANGATLCVRKRYLEIGLHWDERQLRLTPSFLEGIPKRREEALVR